MYEKGHEKIGGRKKGSLNVVDQKIKKFIEKVIRYASKPDKFKELCDKSKPDTILNFIAKVAPKSFNIIADIPMNPIAERLKEIKEANESKVEDIKVKENDEINISDNSDN